MRRKTRLNPPKCPEPAAECVGIIVAIEALRRFPAPELRGERVNATLQFQKHFGHRIA